jgi:23S rRNA (cytosine1962-C5)-methyltransferase
MNKAIQLSKGREKSIERFHPWIFSGAIVNITEGVDEGDVVDVNDHKGAFLASGHYADGSLAVKILTFQQEEINANWYFNRLKAAVELRKSIELPTKNTSAYRLVHGEGDSLPGLIVDVYADTVVLQPHSKGMTNSLPLIVDALKKLKFKNIIHKPIGKQKTEVLLGSVTDRIQIAEHGILYNVDVLKGQKTGFFLDQRDNRKLLEAYSKKKSVLNVFSYSGGFSMAAAKGGASKVVSVDASQMALDLAEENAQLNGYSSIHTSLKVDAVPFIESMDEAFDVIILDPPAFAKHKSARHSAIQAYRRINEAAIKKLQPGGILFTFSCSQVVDRDLFSSTLVSAAINAGRQLQVLHHLRQPADHPVSIAHPEGEYLKGMVLRVLS